MAASFDQRLCDEVRRYPHLYNSSVHEFKHFYKLADSWKEIAETLGTDKQVCRQKWKDLRDRYVKAKRKTKGSSRSRSHVIPILAKLDWLSECIKHRGKGSNCPEESEAGMESSVLQPESVAAGPPADLPLVSDSNNPTRCTSSQDSNPSTSPCSSGQLPLSSPSPQSPNMSPVNYGKRKQPNPTHARQAFEEDEDELFGRLIAKGLRQLPPEKNLELRTEFHSRLNRARLELMRTETDSNQQKGFPGPTATGKRLVHNNWNREQPWDTRVVLKKRKLFKSPKASV